jgi:hypothetical protein
MTALKYLAIAASVWTTLASAEPPPPATIQQTINQFVGALNGTKPEVFAGLFAQQASITDTLGAFNWQGQEVPTRYFAALQAALKKAGWSDLQLAPNGADTIMANGAHAYAAVPLFINYVVGRTKKQDRGMFTLTFTDFDGGWKITSATWTYGTLTAAPN